MHDVTIPAQDTNTNDAANGATSCVFYDTETNGMCQYIIPLCLCCLCAHVVANGYTPIYIYPFLQTGPLRVVK